MSVFYFDANLPGKRNQFPLAKNALRKLRTVRHPDVLRFIDAVESDTSVYIMTERVQPLGKALQLLASKGEKEKEEWFIWGLQRLSVSCVSLRFRIFSVDCIYRLRSRLSTTPVLRRTVTFAWIPSFYRLRVNGN